VKYLFDTDHVSILQERSGKDYAALAARIATHASTDLTFSVVSFHEQALGANSYISRATSTANIIRGYEYFGQILEVYATAPVLPFDANAALVFGNLRGQRIRVGTMDLRIASIALSRNLILLTRNVADFGKVPGLVTEDWTV
jgi:tRNA(fMet)-specific endonuclease VapC